MGNKEYHQMKIKNLKYNVALFTVATSLGIHVIASAGSFPKLNEEVVTPVLIVEIEDEVTGALYQPEEMKIEEMIPLEVQEIKPAILITEPEVIEKEYSGMQLSHELEDEIKRIADEYNVPYEIVLTIGYRESDGNWNNNGVISRTNDYGVFQINKCNLEYIEENLGFTEEDILNDPVKNAEACIFLLKDILDRDSVDSIEEVFGMYNGWTGWRNKPSAVRYSNGCCDIMRIYFPEFEYQKNEVVTM